jgi:hypothetical protein
VAAATRLALVQEPRRPNAAHVVHEDVDPTELLGGLGDRRGGGLAVEEVDHDRRRPHPEGLDAGHRCSGPAGIDVEHGDVDAAGGEGGGGAEADARCAAGDDGNLAPHAIRIVAHLGPRPLLLVEQVQYRKPTSRGEGTPWARR